MPCARFTYRQYLPLLQRKRKAWTVTVNRLYNQSWKCRYRLDLWDNLIFVNIVIGANPSKFCIGDKCEARTVLWAAEFSSSMIDGQRVAGIYLLPSCFESVSWIVACVHALWWRLYVTSYTAWQATLHGKLHCMTSYTAWRATLHDKLRCMASYTAWQATLHDELHCMTSYAAWQATLHDKLHCMTSYTAWQATLHDKLPCMTSYASWQATLHDKPACMQTDSRDSYASSMPACMWLQISGTQYIGCTVCYLLRFSLYWWNICYAYIRLTFLQIMALVVIGLGVPVSLLFQIFIHENATAKPPKQKWYKWLMNPEFYLVSYSS